MVKKLKYLLFLLIFLFITNVNAAVITPSTVYATFDDDTVISSSYYVSSDGNYFASNTLLGGVSYQQWVKAINFYYSNTNLCPNQQLTISGKLRFTNSFFQNESYSLFINNNNSTMSCSTNLTTTYSINDTLNFSCVGSGGGSFSVYFQQNSYNTPRQYDVLISRDLQYSCDVTNTDIITSQNQNTQSIINSQNSNTNSIINNQDSNTQDIINNQDTNTQNIINNQNQSTQNVINNQNETFGNVCYDNFFSPNFSDYTTSGAYLIKNLNTGDKLLNINFIDKDTSVNVSGINVGFSYDTNPNNGFIWSMSNGSINSNLSNITTSGTNVGVKGSYIMIYPNTQEVFNRLTSRYNIQIVEGSETRPFTPYGEKKCINKLDEQTNAINDLNDSITSETQPNTNSNINDMNSMVSSDTPITDLITMPLTLINAYIVGMNTTCSQLNLGNLYGTDLILPCINLEQLLGSTLWNLIDALFSIFLCYNIGMLFISAFDGITSLRDDFDGLYQPKHADTGYQPRHGG